MIPASDDPVRTKLRTVDGEWLAFQEYFVIRRHRDEIDAVRYEGVGDAEPAPGVLAAIEHADAVVIAPSNPPLSIAPILAIGGIEEAMREAPTVIAVSPLFGGRALKGPADRVMASLGMPRGTAGILAAYDGLLTDLVIDIDDKADADELSGPVAIHATDTRIVEPDAAARFASGLLDLV